MEQAIAHLVITELSEVDAQAFRGADRDGAADRDQDGILAYDEIEIDIRATRR